MLSSHWLKHHFLQLPGKIVVRQYLQHSFFIHQKVALDLVMFRLLVLSSVTPDGPRSYIRDPGYAVRMGEWVAMMN
jgi:hypothetical protein